MAAVLLPVGLGIEVGTAEHQQAVEVVEQVAGVCVADRLGHQDGFLRAGPFQGREVRLGDRDARVDPAFDPTRHDRVRRNGDERLARHGTGPQSCSKLRRSSQSVTAWLNTAHSWCAVFTRCWWTSSPNAAAATSLRSSSAIASTMFHGTWGTSGAV